MSKRDYVKFARMIRGRRNHINALLQQANEQRNRLNDSDYFHSLDAQLFECDYYMSKLCEIFARDNERFDSAKFILECQIRKEESNG